MSESKPASQETIANLKANLGLAIDELYKDLKGGLVVRSLMDEQTPTLYRLTQDLQNGIKFILMDVSASCRAEFLANNPYEKRFHMKNVQASIAEGYKLLFNFGKQRKKSLWKKLMKQVHEEGYQELIAESIALDQRLEAFGDTKIDQRLRNLTLHYDKEMIEVYQETASINSDDKTLEKRIHFQLLLQYVVSFTHWVDVYCLTQTGRKKPSLSSPPKLGVNSSHKIACHLINKGGKLENIFKNLSQEDVESLDLVASYYSSFKRIEENIQTELPAVEDVSEIDNAKALTNLQLLLRFMRLDMVSIIDAYLMSSSDIEYALNLRRICVTKVSTMVHLYGYCTYEYEQSIWKRIAEIIPSNSEALQKDVDLIGKHLDKIVTNSQDKDLRATFVHLFDNSKACTNIDAVMSAIEGINPIVQMDEIQQLLEVYRVLIEFAKMLMNALSKDAEEENPYSNRLMNNECDELIQKIEVSGYPDDQKKQLVDIVDAMKRIINNLMI